MKCAIATMESVSPYSQSRPHNLAKLDRENSADYEERTWRNRLHVNEAGNVFIPPMAFKNCLSEAAKFLSLQIPGKGKATYTKHFEAGVLVMDGLELPIKAEDAVGETLFLNADGKRGSGTRVWKTYPVIHAWEGDVTFWVLDETITEDVFRRVLTEAGNFIGIGRWRPRNNGMYGRFAVKAISWQAVDSSEMIAA